MADTTTTVLTSSPQPVSVTVEQTTVNLGSGEIQPIQRALFAVGNVITLPAYPILRNDVVVYYNGVRMRPGTHYNWTSALTITLNFTPDAGVPVDVKYWGRMQAGASVDDQARAIVGVPTNVDAPEGYIPLDGVSTIGSTASGASYAGDVYIGAYAYAWELTAAVHSTYADAATAWAANFPLVLVERTIAVYDGSSTPEYLPAWLEV